MIDKIYFITSNKQKAKSAEKQFRDSGLNIEIEEKDLDIIEPQAENSKEVSAIKARQAFDILKKPLIVEDGGFSIEALNGFPGVYSKHVINMIGIEGIIKLMEGVEDRKCSFMSCTTFINEKGEMFQFERLGGSGIVPEKISPIQSPFAWSEFWRIFYIPRFQKTLSEMSEEELFDQWNNDTEKTSINVFISWIKKIYL